MPKEIPHHIRGTISRSFSNCLAIFVFLLSPSMVFPQDSTITLDHRVITLREVVVRNNLNIASFIDRVRNDTSFYKAFRNLKILGYTALNDIRMMDKKGNMKATLFSRTKQSVKNGCRWMQVLEQKTTGDIFNDQGNWNYYTAEMYAGLFFARDTVCGETNIVSGTTFNNQSRSGLDKHKEQLKMLFFNPGSKIPGIPFIGDKISIFDEDVAARYDFIIDLVSYQGENCYMFKIIPRADLSEDERNKIVINEMTTWFRTSNWEILGRNYDLNYKAGIYDFDVTMEVQMTKFKDYLVPALIRYDGNWDVILKKRERGLFTATLFDFTE
jgi:hypothetical protein